MRETTPSEDIAWLAGLVEGEGCISWNNTPQIQLHMTDKDVVQRAAWLFGSTLRGPHETGHKPTYYTSVAGSRAVGWLVILSDFLGERRQSKADEVLRQWFERESKAAEHVASCPRQKRECVRLHNRK